jgi:hypothetical protein
VAKLINDQVTMKTIRFMGDPSSHCLILANRMFGSARVRGTPSNAIVSRQAPAWVQTWSKSQGLSEGVLSNVPGWLGLLAATEHQQNKKSRNQYLHG